MLSSPYAFSLACIFALLFYYIRSKRKQRAQLPDYFKLSGVPPPTPLPHFDISKARPRPYRPFRWQYIQHMSLKKMEPDWWLELESTYCKRIAQRKALYAQYGKKIVNALPGSEGACRELMEMVIQFLTHRYPNQFIYDTNDGAFENRILGTVTQTRLLNPLIVLLENVPEDFLITLGDDKTGLYSLRAGVSCSAVGWNLGTKIGKNLSEIHVPVPDYKERMEFSMDRFFRKMPCEKPIQRGSWGLEKGQPLFLQPNTPGWAEREDPDAQVQMDISDVNLRVDWQTLRRLPVSRAIVFNFKALFTPVVQLREEPYVPKLLLKVLREGKKELLEYKGTQLVERVVKPKLEEWAKEQEDKGWVPKSWEERTLDEDPFFPGWRS
ncbi:hypothetical protein EDD18DRAFT_609012 [Armillaria luteobubalina]|uniref:Uncharacterized protein n=1 Tax=Armillaria luteobubalina TaxID=153913 RepID=A0AA39QJJ9_9AGAR|nr:hypothetical protein EDD18DRAFT_609012 [Armillaria luteobubalina]